MFAEAELKKMFLIMQELVQRKKKGENSYHCRTGMLTVLGRLNYLLKPSARHPEQESCWLYSFERCGSDGDACLFNGPFVCRQNYDFWNRFHHESGWFGEEKDSHFMVSNRD